MVPHLPAASTSLRSLTAVLVDMESTSLDVKKARIIEIGAVMMAHGEVVRQSSFATRVNPGEPIPDAARLIHGISDEQVEGAPGFIAAWKAFREFACDHLLVGYSLDFDFAVLEREATLAELDWQPPPRLDLRDLVRALNPPLPDFSLDKVAEWLGVELHGRHTALGDAAIAGDVLLALLPLLQDQGIETLADALDAVRRHRLDGAGQQRLLAQSLSQRPVTGALARIDSYPYRHRVRDVMTVPAAVIDERTSLQAALSQMIERKISSLFVAPARADAPHGIVTERDILRAIAEDPQHALSQRIKQVATYPLASVSPEDFLYSAFGRMQRKHYRHLGVIDGTGHLVGAVTQRDLLRHRAEEAIALTDGLDEAAGIHELADSWRRLPGAVRALWLDGVDGRDIAAVVSGELCSLTARAAALAERDIAGTRPDGVSYAVLVLGSAGRGESLLAMEQANALIYEGPGEPWVKQLSFRMNAILDEVGVAYGRTGVMAKNEAWRKTPEGWRQQLSRWLSQVEPQGIAHADLFFDAVPVHGDVGLANRLRQESIAAASQADGFLKLMSHGAVTVETALGWFGRYRLDDDGRMDAKRGGLMPIAAAARVLALRHGIPERGTAARLMALRRTSDAPHRAISRLLEAHRVLLGAVLNQQLEDVVRGVLPSSRIDPRDVPSTERERLKWALEQVKTVRDVLGTPAD